MKNRIYVAATSQHVGKTTSTLGLVATLQQRGLKVGYCKPVGQEFVDLGELKVDKDALLFSNTMNFQIIEEYHSPVIVGRGITRGYLDNPDKYKFTERLMAAAEVLQAENEFVVYEGTGHPGVGSVIDLSNADVAKMLDAPVIMIVEGGIGSTIDKLNANLALFREKGVPILGVIVNKVIPKKMEKVRYYVGKKLEQMGIPLLGLLPYDKSLANPIMESVREAVNGTVLINEQYLDNRVENIISGALAEEKEVDSLKNLLLIVDYRRLNRAIEGILEIASKMHLPFSPISGILINGHGNFIEEFLNDFSCKPFIEENRIPVIATSLDTFGSAVRINQIEVKINNRTPWKIKKAIEMIKEHVNLEPLLT